MKKIWSDKGSNFYNWLMKSWFRNDDSKNYSTQNKGKSAVTERFIESLEKTSINIWQYVASLSNHVDVDKLLGVMKKVAAPFVQNSRWNLLMSS